VMETDTQICEMPSRLSEPARITLWPGQPMSSEQDLIARCLEGSQRAFAELVDRYKVMVFNLVDRMVGDASVTEDLAQDVFVRVYRGLPAFRGDAKLSTWIYRIAYRACLEEAQRPHRQQRYVRLDDTSDGSGRPVSDPVPTEDAAFDGVDLSESVDHWLSQLPPHYRMALTLYYLQERRYEEIAEIMDIPVGTVKTYLHRAKQYLRDRTIDKEHVT